MSMSKKNYVAIAADINRAVIDARTLESASVRGVVLLSIEQLVNDLCETFKRDNSAFDIERFRDACGKFPN